MLGQKNNNFCLRQPGPEQGIFEKDCFRDTPVPAQDKISLGSQLGVNSISVPIGLI